MTNLPEFIILYTPAPYGVFLVILYFLSYFRDPLRFLHPRREGGEWRWAETLLELGLVIPEESILPPTKDRTIAGICGVAISLAAAAPIAGLFFTTVLFSSSSLASTLLTIGSSLLFQFASALVVLFVVIIPRLGVTAHILKKYVSNIGSPSKRLGSRVLHLSDLGQERKKGSSKKVRVAETISGESEQSSKPAGEDTSRNQKEEIS